MICRRSRPHLVLLERARAVASAPKVVIPGPTSTQTGVRLALRRAVVYRRVGVSGWGR
jgi:hypothetical protein